MSTCAERKDFNKLITIENYTGVSFMLHVHTRKAHGPSTIRGLLFTFIYSSLCAVGVNIIACLHRSVTKPMECTVYLHN
jgi:hypothetical protein